MKKAKRKLTVDPIDFERECDYVEPGQRSNQVKLAPLAVMIQHQLAAGIKIVHDHRRYSLSESIVLLHLSVSVHRRLPSTTWMKA